MPTYIYTFIIHSLLFVDLTFLPISQVSTFITISILSLVLHSLYCHGRGGIILSRAGYDVEGRLYCRGWVMMLREDYIVEGRL